MRIEDSSIIMNTAYAFLKKDEGKKSLRVWANPQENQQGDSVSLLHEVIDTPVVTTVARPQGKIRWKINTSDGVCSTLLEETYASPRVRAVTRRAITQSRTSCPPC